MCDNPGPSDPKKRKVISDCNSPVTNYPEIINLYTLARCTITFESTIQFCQHFKLLPKSVNCNKCEVELFTLKERNGRLEFKCQKRSCRTTISARKNSWFENTKISISKSLTLTYFFLQKYSIESARFESSGPEFGGAVTSPETVVDLFSYCREVCVESLFSGDIVKPIGGPNHIVEIDESKFGRRKYNRGRVVEGQWVIGGICRETKESFFVPVADRSEATLFPIIKERVTVGSVIYTDQWAAYSKLSVNGYQHRTVNHSENFVDPESGVHTNLIESTWWTIKRSLPSSHTKKEHFAAHLAEYIWRRQHSKDACLFTSFVNEIVKIYPGL